jgi:uncharacterized YkwD family protein
LSEKREFHENNNFWKWLAIGLIIAIIVFGFGYCNPFNKTFNDFKYNKNNVEQDGNNRFIPDAIEKDLPNHNDEESNLEEHQVNDMKEIKPFYTAYPSTRYHVEVGETLRELAYRLHMSVPELKKCNPNLEGTKPNEEVDPGDVVNVPENTPQNEYEKEVVRLTNIERQKAGLSALTSSNENLNKSAMAKSQDMSNKNYFSHTSPTYGSPFEQMRTFGVTYSYAAENIAQGQRTPQEVVTAWMNSSGHRANILNGKLTQIGVGYVAKGNYWTQQFIGK